MRRTLTIVSVIATLALLLITSCDSDQARPGRGVQEFVEQIDRGALRAKMLAAPEKRWWSKTTDRDQQKYEFRDWLQREHMHFPVTDLDIGQAAERLIAGDADEAQEEVTTKNGARYRLHFTRYDDGVDCSIKFSGHANWN